MYAVIETGGKQHRVTADEIIEIERIEAEAGDTIEIDKVLAFHNDDSISVGAPLVANAIVVLEIVEQVRGEKLMVFKMKRRKGLRRRQGHRQEITRARVMDFVVDGVSLLGNQSVQEDAPEESADVSEAAE